MDEQADSFDLGACRPVVLGSEGRAGRAIASLLASVAPDTVAATRVELDITDYFGLRWELERLEADLVINAAAWSDVDACESDPGRAFAVNATGALNAARAAAACGARMVHLSTDYVFDGTKGEPYVETDDPAPLSVYGRSKMAGELAVLAEHPGALIVRTAWLFGGDGRRPDFVDRILSAGRTSRQISVVSDQRGSPTPVRDLSEGVIALVHSRARGLVHVAGAEGVDRLGFAAAILDAAGFTHVDLVPVAAGPSHAGAPRPADSRLNVDRYEALVGLPAPAWREALQESVMQRTSA
ncbi:MAG: dTDP-4-dehydrorhamnose reductase [Acidobacteriota bacterium]